MDTYLAIRKQSRRARIATRGLRAADVSKRAILSREAPAEERPYMDALNKRGLDRSAARAPAAERDEAPEPDTFQYLPYSDTVVLSVEDPEKLEGAQEDLDDEFIVIPDIPLALPGPSQTGEDEGEAALAIDEWPEESGVGAAREAGNRGAGTMVIILDTGLDADHQEFTGREIDYIWTPVSGRGLRSVRGFDTNGHGTHVAGIIAGSSVGVAPEAELLAAGVIESETIKTSLQRILVALDWALQMISKPENAEKPVILNMSLGFKRAWISEDVVNQVMVGVRQVLIQLADDFNVLPVVAIGNDGAGFSRAPGYFPETLAVGAVDRNQNPAFFSGGGIGPPPFDTFTTPDVVGYGVGIRSSLERNVAGDSRYTAMDGTSMAAPYVSGIAALVAAANPGVQGRDLGAVLKDNALALPHPQDRVGAGLARFAGAAPLV